MALLLVVYHRPRPGQWRSTYESHLRCFSRFSEHEVVYLNTDHRRIPRSVSSRVPHVILFHYTFLDLRQRPDEFERQLKKLEPLRAIDCPKALIPHDEQAHSDLLSSFVCDFGITHVFTPASPVEWRRIYEGVDFERVRFRTVLTGYVDDDLARRLDYKARRSDRRQIDIGYRSAAGWPFYVRHGVMKGLVGEVVGSAAQKRGLKTDISSDAADALTGDEWLTFLLNCKYTLGVEGGSSVFDRDGSVLSRFNNYLAAHPNASFKEVETSCFPGMDGGFEYRLLGPRHFEAVMTRTCQVLVEGDYQGVFQAGRHYLELKRDFSNLDAVLEEIESDRLRPQIVSAAHADLVASGEYSYSVFVRGVLADMIDEESLRAGSPHWRRMLTAAVSATESSLWPLKSETWAEAWKARANHFTRSTTDVTRGAVRLTLSRMIGEDRLRALLARIRGSDHD